MSTDASTIAEPAVVPPVQKVATLPPVPDTAPPAEPRRSNWRDIEPVLKWATVAYGFGFVIVMFHTYRLGLPMLQLMEPVNVWIGAPLAIFAFFLDKFYASFRSSTVAFRNSLQDAKEVRERLDRTSPTLRDMYNNAFDNWADALGQLTALFGLHLFAASLLRRLFRFALDLMERGGGLDLPTDADRIAQKRSEVLEQVTPILLSAGAAAAVIRFFTTVLLYVYVLLACWLYVEMFPHIPQSLGGGRPAAVRLIVSPESLPETAEFADWRPAQSADRAAAKTTLLIPVTLYLHTDREWIVRKGGGPLVSLGEHAVEGVLFDARP